MIGFYILVVVGAILLWFALGKLFKKIGDKTVKFSNPAITSIVGEDPEKEQRDNEEEEERN